MSSSMPGCAASRREPLRSRRQHRTPTPNTDTGPALATKLNVIDRGGPGPATVLIHGQPGRATDWDRVAADLTVDHRVVAIDRPGYGESPGPAVDMVQGAAAVAAEMSRRLDAPAVVVGHSFGGGVALALARDHPELVTGLVLVSSIGTGLAINRFDRLLATPLVAEGAAYLGTRLLARWLLRVPVDPGSVIPAVASVPRHRVVERVDLWQRRPIWRSFATDQRSLIADTPALEHALPSIAIPAIVVTGDRDRDVPLAAAEHLAALLPSARLEVVAGAGHMVPYTHPSAIAAAVRRLTS